MKAGTPTPVLVHGVPLGWKQLHEDSGTESPFYKEARPGLPTSMFIQMVIKNKLPTCLNKLNAVLAWINAPDLHKHAVF